MIELPDLSPEQSADLAEHLSSLVGVDPELWFRTCAVIRNKDGELETAPIPNVLQLRMFAHYRECMRKGEPCLMLILKPRQVGATTGAQAIIYHHNRKHGNLNGSLMGDIQATSDSVFEIYRRFVENDSFPWPDGEELKDEHNKADDIMIPGGSTFSKETAGSKNAGRSGTVQVINMTEAAHYEASGSRDPVLGYLNSFHDKSPKSLGIVDSTPNGPKGWFFARCTSKKTRWKLIFAAWFEFPEHSVSFRNQEEREEFERSLDREEREEMEKYKLLLEQMHWRRQTVEDRCDGDVNKFKQEYPSDPLECFHLSARKKFNSHVISKWKERAALEHFTQGDFQLIDPETAYFVPDRSGLSVLFEGPRFGCRYLVSFDSCTGEDQQSQSQKSDPDWHSIGVWRDGYFSPELNRYLLPRLVALYHSREDIDLASMVAASMSIVYGRCMVIPEVNNCGLAAVKKLLSLNVPVIQRTTMSRSDQLESRHYGWMTDPVTRKSIIDHLTEKVRKNELDIPSVSVLDELDAFIVSRSGRPQAMEGHHDDHVMMTAIGVYNLNAASEYKMPTRRRVTRRQIRRDPSAGLERGWTRSSVGLR